MDFDLLNTFIEVRKTCHFGKAAENLFITQSAVSARIHTLEEVLGTRLFERSTKLVSLTEEGEKFAKHAEQILLAWSKAKLDIGAGPADQNSLAIGTLSGLWDTIFNERMATFVQSRQLLLHTHSYATDDLVRLLKNRTLDLAIIYDDIDESQFQYHVLGNLDLHLFTHRTNGKIFNSDNTGYIHIDWGKSFEAFIEQRFQQKMLMTMRTDNAQTALYLIKNSTCAAYLPIKMTEQHNELARIDKKYAPVFRRKIFACFNSGAEKLPHIKKIIKELQFQ